MTAPDEQGAYWDRIRARLDVYQRLASGLTTSAQGQLHADLARVFHGESVADLECRVDRHVQQVQTLAALEQENRRLKSRQVELEDDLRAARRRSAAGATPVAEATKGEATTDEAATLRQQLQAAHVTLAEADQARRCAERRAHEAIQANVDLTERIQQLEANNEQATAQHEAKIHSLRQKLYDAGAATLILRCMTQNMAAATSQAIATCGAQRNELAANQALLARFRDAAVQWRRQALTQTRKHERLQAESAQLRAALRDVEVKCLEEAQDQAARHAAELQRQCAKQAKVLASLQRLRQQHDRLRTVAQREAATRRKAMAALRREAAEAPHDELARTAAEIDAQDRISRLEAELDTARLSTERERRRHAEQIAKLRHLLAERELWTENDRRLSKAS